MLSKRGVLGCEALRSTQVGRRFCGSARLLASEIASAAVAAALRGLQGPAHLSSLCQCPLALQADPLVQNESEPAWCFSSDSRLVISFGVLLPWTSTSGTEYSDTHSVLDPTSLVTFHIWWDLWWKFKVWTHDTICFLCPFIVGTVGF